jgi:hypothetical protein
MPAVIPFIPLIVGGISAGATAYGAHKASEAQKEAADTQSAAVEKSTDVQAKAAEDALNFQKQTYNARQAAVNPYQNMGAGALAALGSGLGVTPGNLPSGAIPMPSNTGASWMPGMSTTGAKSGFLDPATMAANQSAMPQGFNLTPEQQRIDAQTQASQAAQSLSASSVRPPQVGETRTISGQQAKWDGNGWEAV